MEYDAILRPALKKKFVALQCRESEVLGRREHFVFMFFMCQKVLVASKMPLPKGQILIKIFLRAVW